MVGSVMMNFTEEQIKEISKSKEKFDVLIKNLSALKNLEGILKRQYSEITEAVGAMEGIDLSSFEEKDGLKSDTKKEDK
jgi:hypothetical protein